MNTVSTIQRPSIRIAPRYPGLPAHPQHALARRQMSPGFGGMLSFEVHGSLAAVQRFLTALILPARAVRFGGAMNAANAAGYMVGAFAAATIASHFDVKRMFAVSVFATALVLGASGLTANFGWLIALRLAAGIAGAVVFVTGASLAAAAAAGSGSARVPIVLGLYFGGGGNPTGVGRSGGWSARFMALELIAYGLFGAGYIAYAAFIVAHLRSSRGFTPMEISLLRLRLQGVHITHTFAYRPPVAQSRFPLVAAHPQWRHRLGVR